MKIDPYCLRRKCSAELYFWKYKVYADILGGSLESGCQIRVDWSKTALDKMLLGPV